MKRISIQITGISPLMVHSERLANPRDPGTIELKKLATQRQKTEEIHQQVAELEWRLSMYVDENGEPALPADNILAAVKEGARKRKLGKKAEAAVFSEKRFFPIEYDGPKDLDSLIKLSAFFDYRGVDVGGRRVMRARPRFDDWAVSLELIFDPEVLSKEELIDALESAGQQVGLCEKRPQFGRFSVRVISCVDEALDAAAEE